MKDRETGARAGSITRRSLCLGSAVMLLALLYALSITRDCERQGGVMVRSFSASGWSCVHFPIRRDAPR